MKREKNKRAISQGAVDCDGNIFWGDWVRGWEY